ncbi:MAG: isopentenyl-diphosphate delta-isomerase [Endozoicomonas sp.]|uniref:isopentenyl-diphosphate delta-isomerase n=1 Tax=Endozoicomonas sp. TaxID=1892382 RepID=UPI003D9BEA9B
MECSEFRTYQQSSEDDSTQAGLMGEPLILVDKDDQIVGSASKLASHKAPGILHRAFSVLLFNPAGQLLIQRRASCKITFPDCWANTCCSHPHSLPSELESHNELGVKRAAIRKLNHELGIPASTLSVDDFLLMTKVHYRVEADSEWVEEELDYILLVRADVELTINANEVAEVRWVNAEQLSELLLASEGKEQVSVAPWFRLISEHFLFPWWLLLDDSVGLKEASDREIHRLKF